MKKYTVNTVNENNFEEILNRLSEVCSKYLMATSYKVYDSNMKEEKEYRRPFIKIYRDINVIEGKRNYKIKKKIKIALSKSFIDVEKHRFRIQYEEGILSNYDSNLYNEMKPLIFVDLGYGRTMTINDGDIVEFLPFGGFSIYTDNKFTSINGPLTIYKHSFFPCKKIKDLSKERDKRAKEWEEEATLDMLYYEDYDPIDDPDIYDSLDEYNDSQDDDYIDYGEW